MRRDSKRFLIVLIPAALNLFLASCASGPTPPRKGTPEFYWQAAKETFGAADYIKAADHLESLVRSENPFNIRAQPWKLALMYGMSHGFMEMADSFEYGARANKTNPTPFRKRVSDYRTTASRATLQFAETFMKFEQANKDPEIVLSFAFPTGSAGQVVALSKVANGILIPESEIESAQQRTLERSVILAVSKSVGAGEDAARARAMFQGGEAKVPRAVFMLAMANALFEQSQLYSGMKLDRPDQFKFFATKALDALKTVPETKETKALAAKIQTALKKAGG